MNYGLLFTFLVGIFILVGAFIVIALKSKERIINFSVGLSFSVMIGLVIFDLIPEEYEIFIGQFKTFYICLLILCTMFVGFGILKFLERFIPDHHEHNEEEHVHHMAHIGMFSSIAILVHNIIEGMALYSSSLISTKTGLMLMIGIGLHNIPMGMIIASSFDNHSKKKRIVSLTALFLSTFVGGLILFLFKNISYNALGILLGITSGMLAYISVMELLPMVYKTKDKRSTILGLCTGIIILIIALNL